MTNRKKRLLKGIDSLEEQRLIHEEKRKKALALGEEELVRYYNKEIENFINEKKKKKEILDKQ